MSYAKNYLRMDKIDRLLDATEHPECYSAAEIEELLESPEVREAFAILDKTKSSLQPVITPDVGEEWKRFERKHPSHRPASHSRLIGLFTRNIAAGIAVGIVSFTAVAAIVGVSVGYLRQRPADMTTEEARTVVTESSIHPDTIAVAQTANAQEPETVVFDNEAFETIISAIAEYYGYRVSFEAESARELRLYFRWNQALTMEEVAERLNNFERIHLTLKDKTIIIG